MSDYCGMYRAYGDCTCGELCESKSISPVSRPNETLKLRPEVAAFAQLMEKELRANDHKGGWKNENIGELFAHFQDEVREFTEAFHTGAQVDILQEEGADVANMLMMVLDVCGGIKTRT